MRYGEKSEKDAKKRLKHVEPFFGGMKAIKIDETLIDKHIEGRLDEGASHATVNRELRAISRMFSLGAQKKLISRSDIPYISTLEEDNVKQGFFEDEDYRAIVKRLPSYLKGPVQFAYLTGWRREQIMGISWGMVHRAKRLITVPGNMTKSGDPHTVYLSDPLLTIINERFADRHLGCHYVFHREGHRIKDFRHAWCKACRELGLGYGYRLRLEYVEKWEKKGLKPGPTIHDFRRTAVRKMNRAGIPENIAMKITGHKTNSTYKRYGIVTVEDLKWAAEKQAAQMIG